MKSDCTAITARSKLSVTARETAALAAETSTLTSGKGGLEGDWGQDQGSVSAAVTLPSPRVPSGWPDQGSIYLFSNNSRVPHWAIIVKPIFGHGDTRMSYQRMKARASPLIPQVSFLDVQDNGRDWEDSDHQNIVIVLLKLNFLQSL